MIQRFVYGIRDYGSSIKRTKDEIEKGGVEILHLCTSAQLSLFKDLYVLKMAQKRDVKTVIHFHFGRIPELLNKRNWEGKMILRVCKNADSIIVIDQKSYNALVAYGFNHVYYLPNPLSTDIMHQVEEFKGTIQRKTNKILYVGHVIPSKGVYELVRASKEVENIELHLVGSIDEKTKQNLTEIAMKKDNGSWLHIRGGMPHDDVVKEMLSAGIFALPSYTEGFPNVILESMACGCAIIATPVGAIPEMLRLRERGMCGIEVAVKRVDYLAADIKVFLKQTDLMKVCGRNARERVISIYSMPVIWQQLEQIWLNTRL